MSSPSTSENRDGLRILHVFDHSLPLQSGYVYRSLGLLRGQRALGWSTHHLTSPKQGSSGDGLDLVDGWEFHRTSASDLPTKPIISEVALLRRLNRRLDALVTALRPDVLHAHSPLLNGYPALRVGRRHGIPVFYEVRAFWEDAAVDHGTSREGDLRYRATRYLETQLLRRVDAVGCICQGLAGDIAARGIPQDKITVIPNAVDPDRFAFSQGDAAVRRELGLEGAVVLGFVGSFYAYEGLPFLVQSMTAIRTRFPEVHLLLVGGGPDEAAIRAAVEADGLGDRVHLTGRVPHDQVQRYYDAIDVLVYPRLPMRLTNLVTPLKPLEAMASGRIVLASDVGGHQELIEDNVTGFLFPAADQPGLLSGLERTLGTRANWPAMREAGRRFVTEERNWQAVARRYAPVMQRLVPTRA